MWENLHKQADEVGHNGQSPKSEGEEMASDEEVLEALKTILDLTDESDWHLIHDTVRKYVAEGKFTKEGEAQYKAMVDKMADQREGEEEKDGV